jgi:hypothetical protein
MNDRAPRRRTAPQAALLGIVTWGLVLAVLRVSIGLPEPCPPVTDGRLRDAAGEAVAWFGRNQERSGAWTYLYRPDATDPLPDEYNLVRHAGVLLALEQAATAGIPGTRTPADAGLAFARGHLATHADWTALGPSDGLLAVGASALFVAALAERRSSTGVTELDGLMRSLGRFLVAQVEPDGGVLAYWSPTSGAPLPGQYSVYFTGEAGWALARLEQAFPDEGWGDVSERIARRLPVRDEVEERFPPTPDHWAAYQLDALASRRQLDHRIADYARRLAGILSSASRLQTKGWSTLGRLWGGPVRGAALGTTGEGLAALARLAAREPDLADLVRPLAERTRCVAAVLADQQTTAAEASSFERPDLARGAWFAHGETRMDDQQHSLSAILGALASDEVTAAGAPR